MTYATDVCEAVHAVVSASSFPGTPDYALDYVPQFSDEGQNAEGTEIRTFLQSFNDFEILNRCVNKHRSYTVGVAIRKYVAPSNGAIDDSAVSTLLDAVEALIDTVAAAGDMAGFRLQTITVEQPFDFERLHESGIFQTLISFEYKG